MTRTPALRRGCSGAALIMPPSSGCRASPARTSIRHSPFGNAGTPMVTLLPDACARYRCGVRPARWMHTLTGSGIRRALPAASSHLIVSLPSLALLALRTQVPKNFVAIWVIADPPSLVGREERLDVWTRRAAARFFSLAAMSMFLQYVSLT